MGDAPEMVILPFDAGLVQFRRAIADLLDRESAVKASRLDV
jgi:hypothetical protein